MHHPTDRITHTTAFVTPVVVHQLKREVAQRVHHEGSIHGASERGVRGARRILMKGLTDGGGNVLFNDALNTFYLRLYGVGVLMETDLKDIQI